MNKASKGSSLLTSALGLFKTRPTKIQTSSARTTSARILKKTDGPTGLAGQYSYRSAEIVFDECACDAVKTLARVRFLVRDVPLIPVPNCTMRKCKCAYVRFNDRRNLSEGRRSEFSIRTNMYTTSGNDERRRKIGRRAGEQSNSVATTAHYNFENWDY
jgi:hypothetical protein